MKKILSLLLIQVLLLCGCASRLADPTTTATAAPAPSDAASLETTWMPDTTAPEEETRPAAPDFTVYDQAGNSYRLSDFQGMPVVLNFWASWCGPCKNEMPAFQKAFEIYGQDVHFLIVNLTDGQIETVETAYSYIDGCGYTFPVYCDTSGEAAYQYGIYSIPATYFLHADGTVEGYIPGATDLETLEMAIGLITE